MNKKLLLLIAVTVIGLIALPQVLGLFTGMHRYIRANETNCVRCHVSEGAELLASPYHHAVTGGGRNITLYGIGTAFWGRTLNSACVTCHNINFTGRPSGAHAAVTVDCLVCHTRVRVELNHSRERHRGFWTNATIARIQVSGNEACIACHTNVGFGFTTAPGVVPGTLVGMHRFLPNASTIQPVVGLPPSEPHFRNEDCRKCHAAAYASWFLDAHGNNTSRAVRGAWITHNQIAPCVSCHVGALNITYIGPVTYRIPDLGVHAGFMVRPVNDTAAEISRVRTIWFDTVCRHCHAGRICAVGEPCTVCHNMAHIPWHRSV